MRPDSLSVLPALWSNLGTVPGLGEIVTRGHPTGMLTGQLPGTVVPCGLLSCPTWSLSRPTPEGLIPCLQSWNLRVQLGPAAGSTACVHTGPQPGHSH